MDMKDEKTKGIVAGAIIVASLLLFVIRMKKILAPNSAPPGGAAVAAAAPEGAGTPAGTPTPTPPPPSATPAAGPGVPGVKVAEVLPANPPKGAVKDPFAMTTTYSRLIPKAGADGSIPTGQGGFIPAPPKGKPFTFSIGKTVPGGLPPAGFNPSSLPVIEPVPVKDGHDGGRPMLAQLPTGQGPASLPTPAAPAAQPEVRPEQMFALTGTIDGETPMAILNGNNKSYLVHVGDWLENNLRVQHITPRQVELKDRSGRTSILKLGVTENAS